jgi:hypothetical protein
MQPELKRAPEMFADGVDGERISHFGDRFAYYAKRVRTLTLDQDYCSDSGDINEIFDQDFDEDHLPDPDHYVVHPTVLLAWGRHYHLFPRLSELAVCGRPSLDPARDEQVFGRFIQSPHLISLIIEWGKGLSKLSQESVDVLVNACTRLERMQFIHFGHGTWPIDEEHPLPGLLHRMTSGAARLQSLDVALMVAPVQFATLVCLATMPMLQYAVLGEIEGVPTVYQLPVSPFSALRTLHITDNTPHIHLVRGIVQSCTSPRLADLQIVINHHEDSDGNLQLILTNDICILLTLLGRHTSLTRLSLSSDSALNTDLWYMLPPLPHLTFLDVSIWGGGPFGIDIVIHVLFLYPKLEEWDYRHDPRYYAAVTLADLLELLQPRPMVRVLPVVVASTKLPSEEALSQLGTITYGDHLYVMDRVDTPELREVIQRIFPGVTIIKIST